MELFLYRLLAEKKGYAQQDEKEDGSEYSAQAHSDGIGLKE